MQLVDHLNSGWRSLLQGEFERPYFQKLQEFLSHKISDGTQIYPAVENIFAALNATPPTAVKVVLLGQDPYHGPGQAHGLAFSVPPGQVIPPSLVNIFRELQDDQGYRPPLHGCLHKWADEGVLLLNTVLTVEKSKPGSHRNKGWERFTDHIIDLINMRCKPSVFLLWGNHAQSKTSLIDQTRHCLLKAPHPSPLSAYRGYFGCRHFSKSNRFLLERERTAVDWNLA